MPKTLYDKIWNEHVVHQQKDGTIKIPEVLKPYMNNLDKITSN